MKLNNKGFGAIEIALLVVLVGILGFVGFRAYQVYTMDDNLASKVDFEDSNGEVETLSADELGEIKSLEDITALAEDNDEKATVVSVELEMEDGILVYKIKLSNGAVISFNAVTGAIVAEDSEDKAETDDADLSANIATKISIVEAIRIAQAERPGKDVRKVELELEDGELVFSVRFTDKGRVDVSAETGGIVEVRGEEGKREKSRDDDDDNDNNDDTDKDRDEDEQDDEDDERSGKSTRSSDKDDEDDHKSGSNNDDDDEEDEEDDNSGSSNDDEEDEEDDN